MKNVSDSKMLDSSENAIRLNPSYRKYLENRLQT